MQPEAVVGIDPAAQAVAGTLGGYARIVPVQPLLRWLLGCRGHRVRLPTERAEIRSRA
jgi:hypothetical protein